MLLDEVDEALVIDVSGCRDHHVAGIETLRVSIHHHRLLELTNRFLGAEDGLAERVIFPEILGENFVDEIIGVILIHLDFFEDDATFPPNVFHVEGGIQHQVAKNFHRDGKVFVEDLDVETDALFGGKSVHVPANRVHLAGYVFGCAMLSPLEDHVLDKMGDAIPLGVFIAGAGLYPDADGNRADMLHLFRNHGEAVGQDFASYVAYVFNHGLIPNGAVGSGGPALVILTQLRGVRPETFATYKSVTYGYLREQMAVSGQAGRKPPVGTSN